MTRGSWISKPFWQVFVGVIVAFFIIAAGATGVIAGRDAAQAERDKRQEQFRKESVKRDEEIKAESIRITCGIVLGFERLTPQIPLTGQEDEGARARILKANSDRTAAREILRSSMPKDIVINCPPAA